MGFELMGWLQQKQAEQQQGVSRSASECRSRKCLSVTTRFGSGRPRTSRSAERRITTASVRAESLPPRSFR